VWVTAPPQVPPSAPSGLTASPQYSGSGKNKTLNSVTLRWTDGSWNETAFRIQLCKVVTSGAGKNKTTTCTYADAPGMPLAANTVQHSIPSASLSGKGTYRFRVRSENGNGASSWVEIQSSI
jgi:hypothetical protein